MNKKLFSFSLIFIALFMSALYFSTSLQSPIISALNKIKINYHTFISNIENTIEEHFFQAETIESLKNQLKEHEENQLVMQQLASNIKDLLEINHSTLKNSPRVDLVQAISYEKFGDFNRLWVDMDDYNSSKIYGLVYKDLVAGIVIVKDDKPLALLNKDIKSSYSVYIGEKYTPGIAHGNNAENIVVKFIPTWFKINVGDEVITSGLDRIFFKGLKVGKVTSVSSSGGYQNAIVSPYYGSNELNYFHVIKAVR